MFKQIISSRMEDSVIYIQCYCGSEIVTIYHYKQTSTCPEILSLDYFGNIENKHLTKYKYMYFSRDSFNTLLTMLKQCLIIKPEYKNSLLDTDRKLTIERVSHEFSILKMETRFRRRNVTVWDIMLRDKELTELIEQLEEMKKCVEE